MSHKKPGIQENGGVYLHSCMFKLVAECILKRHSKVEDILKELMPFDEEINSDKGCEPYVFSNCYFAINNSYRYGTAGQSWGTGTAGWFYYGLMNYVYGIQPIMEGMRIDPCFPPSWRSASIERTFRNCKYSINFNKTGNQ